MDFGSYQLDQFLNLLASPRGLLGAIGLVLLVAFSVRFPALRWLVLAVALFVPVVTSYSLKLEDQLISPFDKVTVYGRPIVVVCMLLILAMSITTANYWRAHLISPIAVAFFGFQLCFDVVTVLHGDAARGLLSIIIHTLTFLALGFGLGRWLQSERDARMLLWSVVFTGVLFVGGTLLQLSSNDAPAMAGKRLQGISGNPNYAGLVLGLSIAAGIALLALRGHRWVGRLALLGFLGIAIVFLGWTASRTAALSAAIAILFTFRNHLRRFGVVAAFAVIAVLAFATVYEDAATTAENLLRTNNSRAAVWAAMWENFLEYPLMGVPRDDSVELLGSENSYLLVASLTGVVGLVPLLIASLVAAIATVNLWRRRGYLKEETLLMNYVIGSMLALCVTANLEGILAAVIGIGMSYAYVLFALHRFLTDLAIQRSQSSAPELTPMIAHDGSWTYSHA